MAKPLANQSAALALLALTVFSLFMQQTGHAGIEPGWPLGGAPLTVLIPVEVCCQINWFCCWSLIY